MLFSEKCSCGQSEDMYYELIQSPVLAKELEVEAQRTVAILEFYGKNIGILLRFRTPTVFFRNTGRPEVIQSETDLGYRISFFYGVKFGFFPIFAPAFDLFDPCFPGFPVVFEVLQSEFDFMGCEPFIRLFETFIQMLQHIDHLYDCLLRNRIVRYIADTENACVFRGNHCIFGAVFAVKVKAGRKKPLCSAENRRQFIMRCSQKAVLPAASLKKPNAILMFFCMI